MIPSKPKSETGAVLSDMISGITTNSLTPTTYGWAFFEGGLFFVFVLFFCFGFFVSYFQFNFGMNSLFYLLLYISMFISLLKVESDIYFLISGTLQQVFVYFLFYKVLFKRQVQRYNFHGKVDCSIV
jgi:predicted neutral ceramidase superfamily lipid hydrolase